MLKQRTLNPSLYSEIVFHTVLNVEALAMATHFGLDIVGPIILLRVPPGWVRVLLSISQKRHLHNIYLMDVSLEG